MPMVEVIHAAQEAATREQKAVFTREAIEIFRDVLGTPDGRLRLFFYQLERDDSIAGLTGDAASADASEEQ